MGDKYARLRAIAAWDSSKDPGSLGAQIAELLAEYDRLTTPLTEEQERAAFEAWETCSGVFPGKIKRHSDGTYKLMQTYIGWKAWLARARLAGSAPTHELIDAEILSIGEEYDVLYPGDSSHTNAAYIASVRAILAKAGEL